MSGYEPSDSGGIPLTVEDLFGLVSGHLEAEVLDVHFEPELGYPRMIYIQDESGTTVVWVIDFQEGRSVIQSADDILDRVADERDRWAAMTVTYSEQGYPVMIDIDPSRNTFDEEQRIDVRDLTVAEP
jgi:hypothetical protein